MYYTVGNKSFAERAIAENELATIGDISEYTIIKDADPGQYASVYHLTKDGVNVGEAINIAKDQLLKSVTVKTCTEAGKPLPELVVGDKYLDFEFETTSGTTHSYIAVKSMVKPYTAGTGIEITAENAIKFTDEYITEIAALRTDLTTETSNRISEDSKKVDKEISGTNGKAIIFNEADGGGAQFIHKDGTESFVGVNDGGENGLVAQIYADKFIDGKWQGAKLDVKNGGIYYTVGNKSVAERTIAENELATKGDLAQAGKVKDVKIVDTSIVEDGIATLQVAGSNLGLVKADEAGLNDT